MEGVEGEFGIENAENLDDKADSTIVAERTKKKKKKKKPNGMYLHEEGTVKPRYLATFRPGHNFGERRGWRLNEGSIKYDRKHMGVGVCKYTSTSMCI